MSMYGIMLEAMTGAKSLGRLKRYVVKNANILLKDSATIPDVKAKIPELIELTQEIYWNQKDILKFEKQGNRCVIFTREEQLEFVKIINQIKDNAVIA